MELKDKLKRARKSLGLNQSQFGEKTGFSRSTISEYESGTRKITLAAIEKIAAATNTSVKEWIDNSENIEIKQFEGLTVVIDSLVKVGEISREGECSEDAKRLLMKILEKEIKLYLSRN